MEFNMNAETKCGYLITEKRKKLWKVELEIFEVFDQLCQKHNLKYFLIGGSAIGVERHQGFIPWDDDLDIGMLRCDFEKLLKYAAEELPENLHLQYGVENMDDASCFCRIRRADTTGVIRGQLSQKCNHGIFIEVYPLDNIPSSKILQYIQIEISSLFRQLIECRFINREMSGLLMVFHMLFKGISTKRLFSIWNKVCTFYNGKVTKMVNSVSLPNYAKDKSCLYEYEDVVDTVYKPFENTYTQVPRNNDKVLRVYFGDYMQLPPVEERGMHHQSVAYYDPDTPYEQALQSGLPQRYFAGETELGQL